MSVIVIRGVEGQNPGREHGGLSYVLRAVNEPEGSKNTIVRNVSDLKRHYELATETALAPTGHKRPRGRKCDPNLKQTFSIGVLVHFFN
jgi:hypothetical protein